MRDQAPQQYVHEEMVSYGGYMQQEMPMPMQQGYAPQSQGAYGFPQGYAPPQQMYSQPMPQQQTYSMAPAPPMQSVPAPVAAAPAPLQGRGRLITKGK